MFRTPPPLRTGARVGLLFSLLALFACAGQDIARRDEISFSHSRLASFYEVAPEEPLYAMTLADALRATDLDPGEITSLPRVVRGSSALVDPPYLGRTRYLDGSIFVWEGTEVPLREVLTHEMIHWVLYHAGMTELALNEAYVERLTASVVPREETLLAFRIREGRGASLAEKKAWHDIGMRRRNTPSP